MHSAMTYELANTRTTDSRRQARRDALARAARHPTEPAPTQLTANGARCQALFASGLQRSDTPGPGRVAEAIKATVRQFGIGGCASRMAQEYGDHPEAAAERMRWVRSVSGLTPS